MDDDALSARDVEGDARFMRRALMLAESGWGQTAPNPMVGAVVVSGGEIVGEGFHARYGEAHAEVMALRTAGVRARGATIYVTLEPCAHFGKTPPCVEAILAAGIARVAIAVEDPSPIARGGAERLREAGIHVDIGIERAAALELNAPFFNAVCVPLPWVTLKLAVSSDGAIAAADGRQVWITGPEAREEVHRLRANADAIAVGAGTVLVDDPRLTVRRAEPPRIAPRRVVFDSTLRTRPESYVVRTARDIETILVARQGAVDDGRRAAMAACGVTVVESRSLRDGLERLRAREIRSLFVEGGARIAGALLRDDLVDRLVIFRAPTRYGPGAPRAFAHAPEDFEHSLEQHRVVDERRFGDDVMTIYALHEVPCSRA